MEVGREYGEVVGLVKQLKWLGVTDIITHTGGPLTNIRYLSNLPGITYSRRAKAYGFDYLHVLCRAAHEVGLNVWGFWHPKRGGDLAIKDAKGQPYADYLDIKSPRALEAAQRCIDELAGRYTKYGNFKGIFLDELWHPFVFDRMEGCVRQFVEFCEDRYGEAPPADFGLAAKLARGREWHDPKDKWWRRYVLFRNSFTVGYLRKVTKYANSKGLRTMPQIGFGFHWFQGHGDTHNLARAGNVMWSYEHRNNSRYEHYPRDRVICGTHSRSPGGYQLVALVRGLWGSQFALEQTWLTVGYSKNPRCIETLGRMIRANREWHGAEPLSRLAVLTNRLGLDLSQEDASRAFRENEEAVQLALSRAYPVPMLMVRDTDIYERYKVLIAPQYSLSYLPERVYLELVRYVEAGGLLVLLNGSICTSREDHTRVRDRTEALAGISRSSDTIRKTLRFEVHGEAFSFSAADVALVEPGTGVRTLASMDNGQNSLITESRAGLGRVLSVNFDVARLLRDRSTVDVAIDLMRVLLERLYRPAVRADGNFVIFSALKKDNWVVVTFLPRDSKFDTTLGKEVPAGGRLRVDMEQLGIKTGRYKVINLARDREMMPQGKDWDFWGRKYWTNATLTARGIDVYLPPNSLVDLELPSQCKEEYVMKYVLPRWPSRSRAYEHDIIAIAPANEASMVEAGIPK